MNSTSRLYSVILLGLCALVSLSASSSASVAADLAVEGASHAAGAKGPSVAAFLAPDGRVDMEALRRSGYEGSLDLSGMEASFGGADGEPVFAAGIGEAGLRVAGDEYWVSGFEAVGVGEQIFSLTIYDGDLIAGGNFLTAGGVSVSYIARWDGVAWNPLGSGMSSYVYDLTVYDGDLVATGSFTIAGGISANYVARWDGVAWRPLGSGVSSAAYALAVYNGDLIVGGNFGAAGGAPASNIARWDGVAWSPLGSGVGNFVSALTVYNGVLVAGGGFMTAGGVAASCIAAWDGATWSPLGSGVNDTVFSLTIHNYDLVAGGAFSIAGGVSAKGIARWDGVAWIPYGSGMSWPGYGVSVDASIVYGGYLIAGGHFRTAGGVAADFIARWDGVAWSPIGSGVNSAVLDLVAYDGNLIAGGFFTSAGGVLTNRIAAWNGTSWSSVGSAKGLDAASHVAFAQGADVYVAGEFTAAGGAPAACNRVARWDGATWNPLGAGTDQGVRALAWSGGSLHAGGYFTAAGGVPASRIARWDGSTWSPLGAGTSDAVFALTEYNGAVIAAGTFTQAGGSPASRIASWDGSSWSPLGAGLSSTGYAVTVFNGDLYAGGTFTQAGGQPAGRIARWNGSAWSAIGDVNGPVLALLVHAGKLIVGGSFTTAGAVSARNIAVYDGATWLAVGTGVNNQVLSLTSAGGFLFAGGDFTEAGGASASRIARWDGSAWSDLGSGANAAVRGLTSDGTYLYAGGGFTTAGGKPSSYFGRWDGLLGPCAVSVTQPASGSTFCGGDQVDILWTYGGACGSSVRIDLLRDGQPCAEIATSTENDGLFTWTVAPCGVATAGYSVSVTDLSAGASDTTSGSFGIALPCALDLIAPDGGEDWSAGQQYEIRWSSLPCCGDSVRIDLLRAGQACATVAASTPNDGSFLWTAAQCGGQIEDYRVAILDLTTGATDTSAAPLRIGPAYRILSINDVGNDQGRQVRLRWHHEEHDAAGSDATILLYTIYRKIDPSLKAAPVLSDAHRDALRYPPGDWDFVMSLPANGEQTYSAVCPTLCDSTISNGLCRSTFFVRAQTPSPLLFFDTEPDSGYSVDNLAPSVPSNLRFTSPALLAWNTAPEEDFRYFAVYGSVQSTWDPAAVLIGQTTGTTRDVSTSPFPYYHVTATDFAGNEGDAANIQNAAASGAGDAVEVPARFALSTIVPNPTTSGVTVRYDLPRETRVSLRIFDAAGRVVATLANEQARAGAHAVTWEGVDTRGSRVATGMYFCRMDAGDFTETRKIVIAQ